MPGNDEPEENSVGENHGAEGERVWTYWCEENARDGRVRERPASGEGICGRACRSGDDDTVCLDNGEKVSVAVEFQVGDVRGGSSVED